jgi:hypothetical protein
LFFYGQPLSLIGRRIRQVAMRRLLYRPTDSAFLPGLTAAPAGGNCYFFFMKKMNSFSALSDDSSSLPVCFENA